MSRSADQPKNQSGKPGKDDKPGKGAELAEQAISAEIDHADIEAQIKSLGPEEAAMFARLLEHNLRKRKWMLGGYLAALFAVLAGLTWALWYSGSHPNTFIGWVFIVPPGLAAVIIWAVGAHVRRMQP